MNTRQIIGILIVVVFVSFCLWMWVVQNINDAKRDGVSTSEGVKEAALGCGDGIIKTALMAALLIMTVWAYNLVPSCHSMREPENYRR